MNETADTQPWWEQIPAWAWIVAVGILSHGLVPLTDYVLWDGWWYAADLVRAEGSPVMSRLFHEVGRPLDMWFYLPMRWIGGDPVIAAKWLGTTAWIASAVCIGAVLRRLAGLPRPVATTVAVLVVSLPIFDLLGELALWMNTACVLLFWLAWLLVSRLPDVTGWRAITLRLAALGLFFISFDLNSNLVLFYGVAGAIAGLRLADVRQASWRAIMLKTAFRHLDFLAVPIVFWLWKTWFTPANGFYATGYNQPSLDPVRLATGYLGVAVHFVLRGIFELVWAPGWLMVAAVTAVATAFVVRRAPGAARAALEAPSRVGWSLCGWGLFLLLSSAFPYIAVGQSLASEGWLSRNCILCPLPIAMLVTGFLIVANEWWAPKARWSWIAGVAAFAVLGVGGCIHNYLVYQAFGVKQLSIRAGLVDLIQESHASVVQLRDYVRIPGTIPYYPPVIWTYLAREAKDMPRTFVIETAVMAPDVFQTGPDGSRQRVIPQIPFRPQTLDEAITATTMPYALEKIPRTGPQVLVMVRSNPAGFRPAYIGLRFLFLSWLNPTRAADFVREFTKIEAHPLPDLR